MTDYLSYSLLHVNNNYNVYTTLGEKVQYLKSYILFEYRYQLLLVK